MYSEALLAITEYQELPHRIRHREALRHPGLTHLLRTRRLLRQPLHALPDRQSQRVGSFALYLTRAPGVPNHPPIATRK